MGIRAIYILIDCTLRPVFTIISRPCQYFCKWLYIVSQIRSTAMVFKAIKDLRFPKQITGVDRITDETALFSDCPYVNSPETLYFMSVMFFVVMPHHLISAANTKKHLVHLHGFPYLV